MASCAARPDGAWEHSFGFDSVTADNPGLIVILRPDAALAPDPVIEQRHETRPDPYPLMAVVLDRNPGRRYLWAGPMRCRVSMNQLQSAR